MKTRLMTYQELESIAEAESAQVKNLPLQKWLKTVWQSLVTNLTREPEPQVWQVRNRNGDTCWRVHDPLTGQSASLGTEGEVITWIEQNYYQRIHSSSAYFNGLLR